MNAKSRFDELRSDRLCENPELPMALDADRLIGTHSADFIMAQGKNQ